MPFGGSEAQREIERIIIQGAKSAATDEQIIQLEVGEWKRSDKRKWMIIGERYYRNNTDIKDRTRTVIGESGAQEQVANLANNKLANGFIRKLVDQKVGYLLGRPMSIQTKDEQYDEELTNLFDEDMMQRLQSTGKEAVNKGIAWWFIFYNEQFNLSFKKMNSEEIIPIWADEAHTVLDAVIRDYQVTVFEGTKKTTVRKIEWWDKMGVRRYVWSGSGLIPDVEAGAEEAHFTAYSKTDKLAMNWGKVPFIAWKYNEEEQPLVEIIKELVDDYDRNKSDNSNNLEDLPNSIYIVSDYDGTDAAEFRKNISIHRLAFVSNGGDIKTIQLEIDTEAYKNHQDSNRKDIYEFGRGVDTQSVNFGSAPSGVALRFLYSDLELDASLIETQFQTSLSQLLWFIDVHLYNTTGKDYSKEKVSFVFNRDMVIDESSIITNIRDSEGIISKETQVAQHPWVTDVQAEMERLEKQYQESLSDYDGLGSERDVGKENSSTAE
ncbi:phage portal protein [Paenibacillaceae bacterium]|nr:phage portal protein [Paenibacillaceae bacterium]